VGRIKDSDLRATATLVEAQQHSVFLLHLSGWDGSLLEFANEGQKYMEGKEKMFCCLSRNRDR
jgi:hypothetical protein